MKIDRINLPQEITNEIGLKPILMDRLDKIVVVAGRNGSGKSRLLNLIQKITNEIPNSIQIDKLKNNNVQIKNNLAKTELYIKQNENNKEESVMAQIRSYNKYSIPDQTRQLIINEQQILKENYIKFHPEKIENSIVKFVPPSLILKDSFTISSRELNKESDNIFNIGMDHIADSTIPTIDRIIKKWVNANTIESHGLNITKEEKDKINEDYVKLKKIIKLFLGTELTRSVDGHAELFGKRIGLSNLSNGQIILLQFCMALYAQEASLENLVILMDEPENHLHPAALIEVLDKITPHVINGQIWIATHSINILAHFNPSSIWYMEEGQISYAGNVPQKVLDSLLGDENELEKLTGFLSLPAKMASEKFAFESLFYPNVSFTGLADPQVKQIYDIIQEKIDNQKKLMMLDYGMGKGRLISTIYENERLRNKNVADWLDYYGFDKFDTYKKECNSLLADIYNTDNRYFNKHSNLIAQLGENSLDVIVMCNVFHEIPPEEWIDLFTSPTSPFRTLKDEGFLLIIEDQFLAMGEKAHAKGFLVFDELEFKTLFQIGKNDAYHSTDYRGDGRLKSHHIPKCCLTRIDTETKKKALNILVQNSKEEIKALRKLVPSYKNGKLHGFWTQQLANAHLALEEI